MKTVEIRNLISCSRWEVFGFSETSWSSQVSSHSAKIPGYSLCSSNRSTKKDGGVALYISNKLRSSVVDAESLNKVMENLFVEVEASGTRIALLEGYDANYILTTTEFAPHGSRNESGIIHCLEFRSCLVQNPAWK
uniref:Uncharacterized protein n=1 Tax=Glossina austeni TaxID=7395 RepID=A0A1A9UIA8_GLOAU